MIESKVMKIVFRGVFLFFLIFFAGCDIEIVVDGKSVGGNVQEEIGVKTQYNLVESVKRDMEVVFCPQNDCYFEMVSEFESAKNEVKCAFYELDYANLSYVLNNLSERGIDVELIVDNDNVLEEGVKILGVGVEIYSDEPRTKLMHDKFCIIDQSVVITGSTNPTFNGFFKNNNNMIIIESEYLSKNYLAEFEQMKKGLFGSSKKNILHYNNITLVSPADSYIISNYFCPQNGCEEEIVNILGDAEKEIIFASFVLTSDAIENMLVEKKESGLNVTGIIENRMKNSLGSRTLELNASFNVHLDENKNTMHHKVFVVDEKIVVTGSMNPTKSGDRYNDENILVIRNAGVAKKFKEEILNLI